MRALIRYQLAMLLHGQRYLAPLLLFVAVLAVFTINDAGSLTNVYVACAAAVLACGTWLTVTVVTAEDPVHRAVSVVTAGGAMRVLLATVGLALGLCTVLAVAGEVFPIVSGRHVVTVAGLTLGMEAQMTCACVAVAIGLPCSRLVFRRPGYALIAALGAMLAVALVPGLPPVHPLFRLMSGDLPPDRLLAAATGLLGVAVAALAASTALTGALAVRRD